MYENTVDQTLFGTQVTIFLGDKENPSHILPGRLSDSIYFGHRFICLWQYVEFRDFMCIYTYACPVSLMHKQEQITL